MSHEGSSRQNFCLFNLKYQGDTQECETVNSRKK